METRIMGPDPATELSTDERCSILESWNDGSVVCTPGFRPEGYESLAVPA